MNVGGDSEAIKAQCAILNGPRPGPMASTAMAPEGTPGKWSLLTTHPGRLGAIAELYATMVTAAARAADRRQAGYNVEVTLAKAPSAKA